jgi:predicted TPR repeat methyltransferase
MKFEENYFINSKTSNFEENYFINSKTSNYSDYTGKKFNQLAEDLINECDFKPHDRIVDFGCATGGLIYGLKQRKFNNLKGTDVSYWAIEFGKKQFMLDKELDYFNRDLLSQQKDWLIFLDVLEHIHDAELREIMNIIKKSKVNKGIIIRVPVSAKEGEDYILSVSKNDKTHVQRHCKYWWIKLFKENGFKLVQEFSSKSIYSSPGVFTGWFK